MSNILDFKKWSILYNTSLFEEFKIDGITYMLTFKNQDDWYKYISFSGPSSQLTMLPPWIDFKDELPNNINSPGMATNAKAINKQSNWEKGRNNLVKAFWAARALKGLEPIKLKEEYPREAAIRLLNDVNPILNKVYITDVSSFNIVDAIQLINDVRFDTLIIDPNDPSKSRKIKYWQYFMRANIIPYVSEKQELLVITPLNKSNG